MKRLLIIPLAIMLSACAASYVRYDVKGEGLECPPVVTATASGSSITVNESAQCDVVTK